MALIVKVTLGGKIQTKGEREGEKKMLKGFPQGQLEDEVMGFPSQTSPSGALSAQQGDSPQNIFCDNYTLFIRTCSHPLLLFSLTVL